MKSKPISCSNLKILTEYLIEYKMSWKKLTVNKLYEIFGK